MGPDGDVGCIEPDSDNEEEQEHAKKKRKTSSREHKKEAAEDEEFPKEHVPIFNSAVFFKVPRVHAVTPVLAKKRVRYSIFGWWLREAASELN